MSYKDLQNQFNALSPRSTEEQFRDLLLTLNGTGKVSLDIDKVIEYSDIWSKSTRKKREDFLEHVREKLQSMGLLDYLSFNTEKLESEILDRLR